MEYIDIAGCSQDRHGLQIQSDYSTTCIWRFPTSILYTIIIISHTVSIIYGRPWLVLTIIGNLISLIFCWFLRYMGLRTHTTVARFPLRQRGFLVFRCHHSSSLEGEWLPAGIHTRSTSASNYEKLAENYSGIKLKYDLRGMTIWAGASYGNDWRNRCHVWMQTAAPRLGFLPSYLFDSAADQTGLDRVCQQH